MRRRSWMAGLVAAVVVLGSGGAARAASPAPAPQQHSPEQQQVAAAAGGWSAVTVFPGDYTKHSKPGGAVLFFGRALSNTGRDQQFWYRVVLSCSTVPGSRTRNLRWQTSWQLFTAPPSGGGTTGVKMITAGSIDKRCRRFSSDTGQPGAEKSVYWESASFSPGRTASDSVGAGFISLA